MDQSHNRHSRNHYIFVKGPQVSVSPALVDALNVKPVTECITFREAEQVALKIQWQALSAGFNDASIRLRGEKK